MPNLSSIDDCSEFAFILQNRPPRVVHLTFSIVTLLVGAAILWTYSTHVDLVVRVPGTVRSLAATADVFNPISAETSATGGGRRVVVVNFVDGDRVHRNDVLVRLDTRRLDNDVARLKRAIQAGHEELERFGRLARRMEDRHRARQAKVEMQRAKASQEQSRERSRREVEVRAARSALTTVSESHARILTLRRDGAASAKELGEAAARVEEARARHATAQLPVDQHAVRILARERQTVEAIYQFDREELALRRAAKQAELDSIELELTDAEMERTQAVILAPEDGVVTKCRAEVGDLVEPGQLLVTIAPGRGFRFDVTLPSEDVAQLTTGMAARVKLDALDYQDFGTAVGEVVYVSPDAAPNDEVADAGPASSAGCYAVRIEMQAEELRRGPYHGRLKLGMRGQAEIIVGRQRLLTLFFKKVRHAISFASGTNLLFGG